VAGIASLEKTHAVSADDVLTATRDVLASYKLPKELLIVPSVPRAPNGKADYKAAKQLLMNTKNTL
jgi:fatty-acyl-CoA synthase